MSRTGTAVDAVDPWLGLDGDTVALLRRARAHLESLEPMIASAESTRRFPVGILKDLTEIGYVSGAVPAERGGLGLSHLQSACLMEEAGRVWASIRTTTNILTLVAELLASAGTDEQRAEFLTPLLAGRRLGWFAITEPEAGSDASSLTTFAERLPSGDYRLSGRKAHITNASYGDFGIVLATVDPALGPRGITAFLVEHADGCRIVPHEHMPVRAVSSCDVVIDRVLVPASRVLGEVGRGLSLAMHGVNAGRLRVSAGCVGIAQACLESSVRHATSREQFGRPIAAFQLVQQLVVDIATSTSAARQLYRAAARLLDDGVDGRVACSMAKYFASESVVRVASAAVQVHGAAAFAEGHPVERMFRDAREATIPEGTSQMQVLQIGKALLGVSALR